MKFVIIVALFAAVATAENAKAAQEGQRLWHLIGGIVAGLLKPNPVVVGPAIVDKPIENPIWSGPVIIDGPVEQEQGPVIAEYPILDSPIAVGPVIIDEPVVNEAPILIPQPVFPFPISSPLVQVVVNVDSDSDSNSVSIEQPASSDSSLVDISQAIISGPSGINPRRA